MSNSIIDQNGSIDGGSVDIGNGQVVSMKAVQQMYADITGRTETLERSYKNNHCIGFEDLCQLDAKICQLQEQYNIVSKTCSVTLFHLDDQKQTFSSFERFKLFDRTTTSPVENIRLEYNYLIVLPQMRKPQSYEIEINIQSRAAQMKRVNGDTSARSMMFFEFFSPYTAHVAIEHVDYTVARNFQNAIEGWFKSLHELETGWLLTPLKKLHGYYIFIFRLILVSLYLSACYRFFLDSFISNPPSQATLFAAAVVTFGGMFLMSIVSGKLGSIATESIKRVQCKSYLNLTRGDESAIKQMSAANRFAWIKTTGSFALALGAKVLSEYIIQKIGIK